MWSMLIILVGFALIESDSNCRPKEYRTSDGQCCPMCHEGTIVGRDCTIQSGTRCVPCDTGTYMNQPNGLTRCLPCSFCDPGVGLFAKQNCTPTSDTVCDVLSGYFCKSLADSTGCSTAEKHSVCDPGQRIKQPGTSKHDTVCEVCQEGSFSLHGVNCTLWTKCSESQTLVQEGSLTSDVVCRSGSLRNRYSLLLPCIMFVFAIGSLLFTGWQNMQKTS
ncbi:tumor necrosis factor receptor superfamily member 14-like [Girardinichthys multiradiatus]|uniref:tumor necrosis factor receptor superfamily member 14-like n=1 Tax=Girardinichthys multiradiatus TaxID=208333 RepID=UPI001FAD0D81|nr:tumor necrosis factor receptor superfamily member 14-like [Girardinichthys multiradiatus]